MFNDTKYFLTIEISSKRKFTSDAIVGNFVKFFGTEFSIESFSMCEIIIKLFYKILVGIFY